MPPYRTETKKIAFETDDLMVTDSRFVDRELGVIAKRNYVAGELLFVVKGPVKKKPSKYSFAVDVNLHVEPQKDSHGANFGHYTNHACDPTAFVRVVWKNQKNPYLEVIARKPIKKGEEVTFDYASLEYELTINGAICKCISNMCRGKIYGFKDLPHDVIRKYKKEGLIPAHLASIKPSPSIKPQRKVRQVLPLSLRHKRA